MRDCLWESAFASLPSWETSDISLHHLSISFIDSFNFFFNSKSKFDCFLHSMHTSRCRAEKDKVIHSFPS